MRQEEDQRDVLLGPVLTDWTKSTRLHYLHTSADVLVIWELTEDRKYLFPENPIKKNKHLILKCNPLIFFKLYNMRWKIKKMEVSVFTRI